MLPTDWNGLYDPGEQPLAGYPVYLYAANDLTAHIAQTQTDLDGTYIFENLIPGNYIVGLTSSFIDDIEYLLPMDVTSENQFEIDWRSNPIMAFTGTLIVTANGSVENINGGMRLPMGIEPANVNVTVHGRLVDWNNQPIANRQVTVSLSYDSHTTTVTTDSTGNYSATFTGGLLSSFGTQGIRVSPSNFPAGGQLQVQTMPNNALTITGGSTVTVSPVGTIGNVGGNPGSIYIATYNPAGIPPSFTGQIGNVTRSVVRMTSPVTVTEHYVVNGTSTAIRTTTSQSPLQGAAYSRTAPNPLAGLGNNYRYLGYSFDSPTGALVAGNPTAANIGGANRNVYMRYEMTPTVTEVYRDTAGNTVQGNTAVVQNMNTAYSKAIPAISGYLVRGYKFDTPPLNSTDYVTATTVTINPLNTNRVVYFVYLKDETAITVRHLNTDGTPAAADQTTAISPATMGPYTTNAAVIPGYAPQRVELDGTTVLTTAVGSPITNYTIDPTVRGAMVVTYYYDRDSTGNGVPDYDVVEKYADYTGAAINPTLYPDKTTIVKYGDTFTPDVKTIPNNIYQGYYKDGSTTITVGNPPTGPVTTGTVYVYEYVAAYNLTYNVNGGLIGSGPPDDTNIPDGSVHTLSLTGPTRANAMHNGVSTPVVFVGWSASAITTILEAKDTASLSNIITFVTINGANEVVYAVWGYDTTGTTTPDVSDTQYKIEYDLNGGDIGSGPLDDEHLLSGVTYHLNNIIIPTHVQDNGFDVFFVGWSTSAMSILTKDDVSQLSALITTVTIGTSNEIVYAVWGYDTTGTMTPDVTDPQYKIEYDVNGGITGSGPADDENLLDSVTYNLNTTTIPTHANEMYKGVSTPVVLVGWSASAITSILEASDTASLSALITTVTIAGADEIVYAVWGYDTVGLGVPDVKAVQYKVEYDVNGGNADGPTDDTNIPDGALHTLNTATIPTHANEMYKGVSTSVVFVGWSASAFTSILEASDIASLSSLITTVT
ncbi:MAG: hypothetical protein FWE54_06740, partial [Methanimicrococcus sp.]|nr:hypothetical protein [Methanimicrococcus sp.]